MDREKLEDYLEGKIDEVEVTNEGALTKTTDDYIEVDSDTGGISKSFYKVGIVEEEGQNQVWLQKSGMGTDTTWKFSTEAWNDISSYVDSNL
jgi:hypothetical protein